MTPLIFSGAIFFTLALIFYSVGIWNDYVHKELKKCILVFLIEWNERMDLLALSHRFIGLI